MWLRFDLLRLEIKFPEITDDVLLKCEYKSAQPVYCGKSLLRINFFFSNTYTWLNKLFQKWKTWDIKMGAL